MSIRSLRSASCSLGRCLTGPADSTPVGLAVEVGPKQRMVTGTVRLSGVHRRGNKGRRCGIRARCPRNQVCWIDAASMRTSSPTGALAARCRLVMALVVEVQSTGDRPDQQFVNQAMGSQCGVLKGKLAVSLISQSSLPLPTARPAIKKEQRSLPGVRFAADLQCHQRVAVGCPALVVHRAQSPSAMRARTSIDRAPLPSHRKSLPEFSCQ